MSKNNLETKVWNHSENNYGKPGDQECSEELNVSVTTFRRSFNDYKSNGIENFIKMIKRDDKKAISEDFFVG